MLIKINKQGLKYKSINKYVYDSKQYFICKCRQTYMSILSSSFKGNIPVLSGWCLCHGGSLSTVVLIDLYFKHF
jgi:heme O synthase-like polyprenyltransferase